jgi:bifunctional non-homologous end joining protein LigD
MANSEYNRKRNFAVTSEPQESKSRGRKKAAHALQYVIQKHDARRLHYDFRLELAGTLKSWAVPKGPSLDPKDKRLAVHVEDHPLSYATFEGTIPAGQYGGGEVIVWDQGIWLPHGDPEAAYRAGKLKFTLTGEKLSGDWALVRTRLQGGKKEQWLLIKENDEFSRAAADYDIVAEQPQSVLTGKHIGGKERTVKKRKQASEGIQPKIESTRLNKKSASTLPKQLKPELATLVDTPPAGEWIYEIKYDGYRILARIEKGEVRLITRNDNDWTLRMPQLVKALDALKLRDSWLDGEVVVLNDQGLPDFQALQRAFEIGRSVDIVYYLFDAPFLNGEDLRQHPVEERRARLEEMLPGNRRSPLRFSQAFAGNDRSGGHRDIVASACAMSLEGLIGKRLGSVYFSGRSSDWIKLKCRRRQEFVIVGYTEPQGTRTGFGALLLGVYSGEELNYAGRVGTGFTQGSLAQLKAVLQPLKRTRSPLAVPLSGIQARGVHWVEPQLVAEVEFAEWTGDGILRQASFIALRTDKPATEIVRETAIPTTTETPRKARAVSLSKSQATTVAGIHITHPERVIDPQSGATKAALAEFYAAISEWLLPHLQGRAVSLLRAPEGIAGEKFFQKHAENVQIPHIHHLPQNLDPGHARLMEINSLAALVGTAQMGTIELHTWGSSVTAIEYPDRFILDLDPDPALPWRSVIEAARLALAVLDELDLEVFIKTTGGKGLHLVVPLGRKNTWIEVKNFTKALAEFLAKEIPQRFVAKMGPKNRIGKIFVDYLRNQRGASTVAAYSVRAHPGLPVSVPISRDELLHLQSSAQWHIGNLQNRLAGLKTDPWHGYRNKQVIKPSHWQKLGEKNTR